MLNAKMKGGNGEREIALLLNGAIGTTMRELGYPEDKVLKGFTQVQRNQNQSAVGGKDLVGVFDLAVEVKRCEVLNVNRWWAQACVSAVNCGEKPVLLWRQNRTPWMCRMYGHLLLPNGEFITTEVNISWDPFYNWFRKYVREKLNGQASKLSGMG